MSRKLKNFLCRSFRWGCRKKPLYQKRIPSVQYDESIRELIKDSYALCGSVDGMLAVSAEKAGSKKAKKHFQAARSYLKESPYKDYETALYVYAGDGSAEVKTLMETVIRTEIRKRQGLPLK